MEIETTGDGRGDQGEVETNPSPGDPEVYPLFLWHPKHAPKGMRFYSDDLPKGVTKGENNEFEGNGWVPSYTLLENYVPPESLRDEREALGLKPLKVPTHDLFLFHAEKGAKRFSSDKLPTDPGWCDSPAAAAAYAQARVDGEPPPSEENPLDPYNFADLDEFMAAYTAALITDDMSPTAKGNIKKEGIAEYARVKFQIAVNTDMRVSEMAEAVAAVEVAEAAKNAPVTSAA